MKKALISGITGQDGSFLAEFLLQKGYEVHGILRRSSSFNTGRIEHLYFDEWVRDMKQKRTINLHYGDMTDSSSLIRIIQSVQPDEIYNLAAQSHVKVSFDVPEYTAETDAVGTLRMLEAVRILGMEKKTRIYQASTSELFGKVQEVPQSETTPFYPRSPYGVAKQYGFWITKNYRESYGMFAVNGILFNHESERRGETFVTRKITLAAARIAQGFQDKLYLGNLDARRELGICQRLHRVHVAHPAARHPRRLRHCHRRNAYRTRICDTGIPRGRASLCAGKAREWMRRVSTHRPEKSSWKSTPNISGLPKWNNCWATPPKQKHCWDGIRGRPVLKSWYASWQSTT